MIRLTRRIFTRAHFAALRLKIRRPPPWLKTSNDHGILNKNDSQAFQDCYVRYVREISTADMAVSYECARLLDGLCHLFACQKMLDLGSGFSSYTLRRYASNERHAVVWSVDDDERWMRKTENFLNDQNVSTDKLIMLDDFMRTPEGDFDLIFLDLNFVEVRKNFIKMAVERCKPGGMIVFDDVHKPDFLYEVLRLTAAADLTFFDVKSLTRDQFGRYALLGIKNA